MSGSAVGPNDRHDEPRVAVGHLFRPQCERSPDAVALLAPGGRTLTYGRLAGQVQYMIESLGAIGIGPGDRVVVALPGGAEMAVALLALTAGATCAPLDPFFRRQEYQAYLSRLGARALVVQAGMDSPARAAAADQGVAIIDLSPVPGSEAGLFTLTSSQRPRLVRGVASRPDDIALLLLTSGTASSPKLVPLSHGNLCASVDNIRASLALAPTDRCLNLMPLVHVHGFMALLSSLAAGASVVCPSAFDAARVFEWIDESRPTWYTAVPAIHHAVLTQAGAHRNVIARRPLRFIRSCSAPLPGNVRIGLERVFDSVVIEAYGMTEASHQIAANPLPPRERRAGSVGLSTGVEIRIVDESGVSVPDGEVGEVVIRGPNVMRGYADDVPANAGAFFGRWLRTGDLGRLDPDGYLFITGRLKEIINRGGAKISPAEIDRVLCEHPSVAEAVTFPVPHPTLGEDLAAAVVLQNNAGVTVRELREFAAARLADFKVPGRVVILPEIPKGKTGKPERLRLAERLGLATHGPSASPRTATEHALADIWTAVLDVAHVGAHDDYFALGGDSIRAALIASRIERTLGTTVAVRDIFDFPTVAGLAARIDSDHSARAGGGTPQIPRAPRDGGLPLSFAQESFWLAEQLAHGSSPYNVHSAFRLRGRLDAGALARSLDELVTRHEVLRTTFARVDGQLRQMIRSASSVTLRRIDLRALAEDEREAEARRTAAEEAGRPFDLSRDPGLRALLLELGDADHLLLLVTHEAIADSWSLGILLGEMALLYAAFREGRPSPLPPLPIQYADYAVWQRQRLRGPHLEAGLAYWRRQLDGAPPLDLPTDRPRSATRTFRGGIHSFRLPRGLTDRLKALSREEGVTLFMTLLAGFQVLLHRYSRQDDITVGSPAGERPRAEVEPLVGCFVNTLVLRTDLSGAPTFRDLLARVRQVAVDAYAHRDAPFEQIVEALAPQRVPSRPPLFQVMLVLDQAATRTLTLPGLSVDPLELPALATAVELSLSMKDSSRGLLGTLSYSLDLFDGDTIARLAGHLLTLLDGAAARPERPVAALPLLTERERHQLLVEWNDTHAAYGDQGFIHQQIEAQAERRPETVAVVFEGESLSYRELNGRANRLAHHLRVLGVGPDCCVGIFMERSLEMVLGILGTLKAGGAYVPLEPGYPRERLAYMLGLARPLVVLTQGRLADALPPHEGRIIRLDIDHEVMARESVDDPPNLVTGQSLAYIIFTSGSTGRPKGVMNTHEGLRNRLLWMQDAYGLTEADRVLQKTPFSFDVSVWEFLWPLAWGARLVVARPGDHQDSAYLTEVIAEQKITTVHFVPSMLRVFLESAELERCGSLRRVISSGEALDAELQERFFARLGGELHNLYGPTEAAVDVTSWPCERGGGAFVVPIGRPIANTQIYLLDQQLEPVPVGVPGELHIGGANLARGYLGEPELTADRFIPDPFGPEPGRRLYKTGDLARYRADGAIEFLGRVDHQLKINGVRVEPEEVEATLRRHRDVKDVVVVARADTPADKRLVAYFVAVRPHTLTGHELRRFIKRDLPEPMVPSTFVELPSLPLMANGKVDRRALPAPDRGRPETGRNFVAPRTPTEVVLARIWADVLGIERVGADDDFFELGGHSLLALRIVARVREAFGIELALRRLFDAPTVAEMALALVTAREERAAQADQPSARG